MTGFIIVFAKMSDVYGRKSMLLTTTILFTIFSGACGAAQTMDQLQVSPTSSYLVTSSGLLTSDLRKIESSSELFKASVVPVTLRCVQS